MSNFEDIKRQEALNKYRFLENGKDIFPRNLNELTSSQKLKLDYLLAQKEYLDQATTTVKELEKVKANLLNTQRKGNR